MRALVPVRRMAVLGVVAGVASRAVLAASVAWLAVLGAVYASDAGPPLPALVVTAAALYPLGAWAAAAHLAGTSPELRALLTAASGRWRVLAADAVAPLAWVTGASVLGVLAAAIFDPRPDTAAHYALGGVLHLLAGGCGVALALMVHALRLTRGSTALVIIAGTVATLLVPPLPPAGPALAAWIEPDRTPGVLAACWSLLAPALLAGALTVATAATRRHRL